jgi:hypothetical protein
MTVWGEDHDGRVQIEFGCDDKDVWLSFNKYTQSVVMTHSEGEELIKQLREALDEARSIPVNIDNS